MRRIAAVVACVLAGVSTIGDSIAQNTPDEKGAPPPHTASPSTRDSGTGTAEGAPGNVQDLTLSVGGPRLAYLHRPLSLVLTLFNARKEAVKDGLVIVVLPPELEYVKSTPPGAYLKPTVTWSTGDLAPESRKEIVLECRAALTGPGRVTGVFTSESLHSASGMRASLGTGYDLKIIGIPAMHISTYDTEDPVEVGKQTVYVVETRNEGTGPCTNILITCQIPEQMEFVKADGPVPSKQAGGKVSFEAVPLLKPGEKLVYKVTCKAVREGSAKHTATLQYDQFDKTITDEEGTSIYK